MIRYKLNENTFTLGDTVLGSCQWFPSDKEIGKVAELKVWCRAEGIGVDSEILYQTEILPRELNQFSCKIPLDAHPSYDGELLKIIWEVRVDSQIKGLKGFLVMNNFYESKAFRVVAKRSFEQ